MGLRLVGFSGVGFGVWSWGVVFGAVFGRCIWDWRRGSGLDS